MLTTSDSYIYCIAQLRLFLENSFYKLDFAEFFFFLSFFLLAVMIYNASSGHNEPLREIKYALKVIMHVVVSLRWSVCLLKICAIAF